MSNRTHSSVRKTCDLTGTPMSVSSKSPKLHQQSSYLASTRSDNIEHLRSLIASQIRIDDLQAAVAPLAKQELKNNINGSIPVSGEEREAKIRTALQSSGLIDRLSDQLYGRIQAESKSPQNSIAEPPPTSGIETKSTASTHHVSPCVADIPSHNVAPSILEKPSLGSIRAKRGYRYLHIFVERGRAFIGDQEIEEDPTSLVSIHLSFGNQRFATPSVMSRMEPHFNAECLFELPLKELNILADSPQPIHIVAIRTNASQKRIVIGVSTLDWRKVLYSGTSTLVAELKEISNPEMSTGVIECRIELFPAQLYLLSRDEVQFHVQRDLRRNSEANRLFFLYAKQWWADFIQIRPGHIDRLVKIFAHSESGNKEPVTNFVSPLKCRWIESPRHAARFVSLIGLNQLPSIGNAGGKMEIWQQLHTVLTAGHGDVHDHALLLCNLFLGFSLDAYVVLGTDRNNLAYVWVATISSVGNVSFWESLTGAEFKQADNHHFRTVGCCFNAESFYANIQASDAADRIDFTFLDQSKWKEMSKDALASMKQISTVASLVQIGPYSLNDPHTQEVEMELTLQQYISHYREDHGLTTMWDDDLAHLLGQSLWTCENQKLIGQTNVGSFSDDFHTGIKRSIPEGHTFKGFPCQFNHCHSTKVFSTLIKTKSCKDIALTTGDKVRFSVRVKIFPYADTTMVCWVMLGVRYQSI
ncbi:hypothetical protein BDEG_27220 [Batrachochytrium dendrobatidis JEL423]|uniref:C2 domain-containing protein n=1 Tax=Batrachochytrium dendrobatidis (strain JEL423) TaxID=403673 RepID=A0A177WVG6_BATDL|nr:hypothetical protein BDEG_27220 [Batrachochytrium dendrobatidis JEL423]